MSYSIDLKKRVVSFIEEGGSKVEATKRFSVGRRTVFKWMKKKREFLHLGSFKRKNLKNILKSIRTIT
jgi:transposase